MLFDSGSHRDGLDWARNLSILKGESCGIVYYGSSAVGIVVRRAKDDWVLFQPLREAIDYLADELDMDIECF